MWPSAARLALTHRVVGEAAALGAGEPPPAGTEPDAAGAVLAMAPHLSSSEGAELARARVELAGSARNAELRAVYEEFGRGFPGVRWPFGQCRVSQGLPGGEPWLMWH